MSRRRKHESGLRGAERRKRYAVRDEWIVLKALSPTRFDLAAQIAPRTERRLPPADFAQALLRLREQGRALSCPIDGHRLGWRRTPLGTKSLQDRPWWARTRDSDPASVVSTPSSPRQVAPAPSAASNRGQAGAPTRR